MGITLFLIGSIITRSLDKSTFQNQIGFGIYLIGIVISIFGVAGTIVDCLEGYLNTVAMFWVKRRRVLTKYAWVVAVGAVLITVGLLTAANFEKHSIINNVGYNLALLGMPICACGVLVASGALISDYGTSMHSRRKPGPYAPKSPGMVKCSNCGFEIVPGLAFCGKCGSLLAQQKQPMLASGTVRCFRCGKISPAKNRFCGRCGASLKEEDDTKIY